MLRYIKEGRQAAPRSVLGEAGAEQNQSEWSHLLKNTPYSDEKINPYGEETKNIPYVDEAKKNRIQMSVAQRRKNEKSTILPDSIP